MQKWFGIFLKLFKILQKKILPQVFKIRNLVQKNFCMNLARSLRVLQVSVASLFARCLHDLIIVQPRGRLIRKRTNLTTQRPAFPIAPQLFQLSEGHFLWCWTSAATQKLILRRRLVGLGNKMEYSNAGSTDTCLRRTCNSRLMPLQNIGVCHCRFHKRNCHGKFLYRADTLSRIIQVVWRVSEVPKSCFCKALFLITEYWLLVIEKYIQKTAQA